MASNNTSQSWGSAILKWAGIVVPLFITMGTFVYNLYDTSRLHQFHIEQLEIKIADQAKQIERLTVQSEGNMNALKETLVMMDKEIYKLTYGFTSMSEYKPVVQIPEGYNENIRRK